MKWILMVVLLLWVSPQSLPAAALMERDADVEKTWSKFNKAVDSKANEVKQIVFGPITKFLGVLGIAYGVMKMLTTGSPTPVITYGGIGLLIAIIPYFIDTIFGAVLP